LPTTILLHLKRLTQIIKNDTISSRGDGIEKSKIFSKINR